MLHHVHSLLSGGRKTMHQNQTIVSIVIHSTESSHVDVKYRFSIYECYYADR